MHSFIIRILGLGLTAMATLGIGATYIPTEFRAIDYYQAEATAQLMVVEMKPVYIEDEEIEITLDEAEVDLLARTIYAEARGLSVTEQAAVAWCVLNRVDAGYGTLTEVLTAPHQFATWHGEIAQEQRDIAADVRTRWEREKAGEADVGRVLPCEYLWFTGDGVRNYFRDAYTGGEYWNWGLESPYEEEEQ